MKNPFMKAAELLGSPKEKMITRAEKWKPLARKDQPRTEDYPILIWLAAGSREWEIWTDPRRSSELVESDKPFVWFSLPQE